MTTAAPKSSKPDRAQRAGLATVLAFFAGWIGIARKFGTAVPAVAVVFMIFASPAATVAQAVTGVPGGVNATMPIQAIAVPAAAPRTAPGAAPGLMPAQAMIPDADSNWGYSYSVCGVSDGGGPSGIYAASIAASNLLPINRWGGATNKIHYRLGNDFYEDITQKVQRGSVDSTMLMVGNTFWSWSVTMTEWANRFCVSDRLGFTIDKTLISPLFNSMYTSGTIAGIAAAFIGYWVFRKFRGSASWGQLAKAMALLSLLSMMTIGATKTTDTAYGAGSPGWMMANVNSTITTLANIPGSAFVNTAQMTRPYNTLKDMGNNRLHCLNYTDALVNKYKSTYGSFWTQPMAAVPQALDGMWQTVGLQSYTKAQFGTQNSYGDMVFCSQLELNAGIDPKIYAMQLSDIGDSAGVSSGSMVSNGDGTIGARFSTPTTASAGLPVNDDVLKSPLFTPEDNEEVDMAIVSRAACGWNGSNWYGIEGWNQTRNQHVSTFRFGVGAVGADLPIPDWLPGDQMNTRTLDNADVSKICKEMWQGGESAGDGKGGASKESFFNWPGNEGDIKKGTPATERVDYNPQDFLLNYHGNQTGYASLVAFLYALVSMVMLVVFTLLAGATLLAKAALIPMGLFFFFIILWDLLPWNNTGAHTINFAKKYLGVAIFAFSTALLLGVVTTVTTMLNVAGTQMGLGSIPAILWAGICPVLAIAMLKLLFGKVFKMPDPFSVKGAAAYAASTGMIGNTATSSMSNMYNRFGDRMNPRTGGGFGRSGGGYGGGGGSYAGAGLGGFGRRGGMGVGGMGMGMGGPTIDPTTGMMVDAQGNPLSQAQIAAYNRAGQGVGGNAGTGWKAVWNRYGAGGEAEGRKRLRQGHRQMREQVGGLSESGGLWARSRNRFLNSSAVRKQEMKDRLRIAGETFREKPIRNTLKTAGAVGLGALALSTAMPAAVGVAGGIAAYKGVQGAKAAAYSMSKQNRAAVQAARNQRALGFWMANATGVGMAQDDANDSAASRRQQSASERASGQGAPGPRGPGIDPNTPGYSGDMSAGAVNVEREGGLGAEAMPAGSTVIPGEVVDQDGNPVPAAAVAGDVFDRDGNLVMTAQDQMRAPAGDVDSDFQGMPAGDPNLVGAGVVAGTTAAAARQGGQGLAPVGSVVDADGETVVMAPGAQTVDPDGQPMTPGGAPAAAAVAAPAVYGSQANPMSLRDVPTTKMGGQSYYVDTDGDGVADYIVRPQANNPNMIDASGMTRIEKAPSTPAGAGLTAPAGAALVATGPLATAGTAAAGSLVSAPAMVGSKIDSRRTGIDLDGDGDFDSIVETRADGSVITSNVPGETRSARGSVATSPSGLAPAGVIPAAAVGDEFDRKVETTGRGTTVITSQRPGAAPSANAMVSAPPAMMAAPSSVPSAAMVAGSAAAGAAVGSALAGQPVRTGGAQVVGTPISSRTTGIDLDGDGDFDKIVETRPDGSVITSNVPGETRSARGSVASSPSGLAPAGVIPAAAVGDEFDRKVETTGRGTTVITSQRPGGVTATPPRANAAAVGMPVAPAPAAGMVAPSGTPTVPGAAPVATAGAALAGAAAGSALAAGAPAPAGQAGQVRAEAPRTGGQQVAAAGVAPVAAEAAGPRPAAAPMKPAASAVGLPATPAPAGAPVVPGAAPVATAGAALAGATAGSALAAGAPAPAGQAGQVRTEAPRTGGQQVVGTTAPQAAPAPAATGGVTAPAGTPAVPGATPVAAAGAALAGAAAGTAMTAGQPTPVGQAGQAPSGAPRTGGQAATTASSVPQGPVAPAAPLKPSAAAVGLPATPAPAPAGAPVVPGAAPVATAGAALAGATAGSALAAGQPVRTAGAPVVGTPITNRTTGIDLDGDGDFDQIVTTRADGSVQMRQVAGEAPLAPTAAGFKPAPAVPAGPQAPVAPMKAAPVVAPAPTGLAPAAGAAAAGVVAGATLAGGSQAPAPAPRQGGQVQAPAPQVQSSAAETKAAIQQAGAAPQPAPPAPSAASGLAAAGMTQQPMAPAPQGQTQAPQAPRPADRQVAPAPAAPAQGVTAPSGAPVVPGSAPVAPTVAGAAAAGVVAGATLTGGSQAPAPAPRQGGQVQPPAQQANQPVQAPAPQPTQQAPAPQVQSSAAGTKAAIQQAAPAPQPAPPAPSAASGLAAAGMTQQPMAPAPQGQVQAPQAPRPADRQVAPAPAAPAQGVTAPSGAPVVPGAAPAAPTVAGAAAAGVVAGATLAGGSQAPAPAPRQGGQVQPPAQQVNQPVQAPAPQPTQQAPAPQVQSSAAETKAAIQQATPVQPARPAQAAPAPMPAPAPQPIQAPTAASGLAAAGMTQQPKAPAPTAPVQPQAPQSAPRPAERQVAPAPGAPRQGGDLGQSQAIAAAEAAAKAATKAAGAVADTAAKAAVQQQVAPAAAAGAAAVTAANAARTSDRPAQAPRPAERQVSAPAQAVQAPQPVQQAPVQPARQAPAPMPAPAPQPIQAPTAASGLAAAGMTQQPKAPAPAAPVQPQAPQQAPRPAERQDRRPDDNPPPSGGVRPTGPRPSTPPAAPAAPAPQPVQQAPVQPQAPQQASRPVSAPAQAVPAPQPVQQAPVQPARQAPAPMPAPAPQPIQAPTAASGLAAAGMTQQPKAPAPAAPVQPQAPQQAPRPAERQVSPAPAAPAPQPVQQARPEPAQPQRQAERPQSATPQSAPAPQPVQQAPVQPQAPQQAPRPAERQVSPAPQSAPAPQPVQQARPEPAQPQRPAERPQAATPQSAPAPQPVQQAPVQPQARPEPAQPVQQAPVQPQARPEPAQPVQQAPVRPMPTPSEIRQAERFLAREGNAQPAPGSMLDKALREQRDIMARVEENQRAAAAQAQATQQPKPRVQAPAPQSVQAPAPQADRPPASQGPAATEQQAPRPSGRVPSSGPAASMRPAAPMDGGRPSVVPPVTPAASGIGEDSRNAAFEKAGADEAPADETTPDEGPRRRRWNPFGNGTAQ